MTIVVLNQVPQRLRNYEPPITPEDFGVRGDGVTSDSANIRRMLQAAPDGAVVRFTPGKTYAMDELVSVTGKSLTVLAHGATFKAKPDSIWHFFTLGGSSASSFVESVEWYGGVFDGDHMNQRRWPFPLGDYANSNINGETWDNAWAQSGNNGAIRCQFARQFNCQGVQFYRLCRNGVTAWDVTVPIIKDIYGEDLLPVSYHELAAYYGQGYECALVKVSGGGSEPYAYVSGISEFPCVEGVTMVGGAMPVFYRTQAFDTKQAEQLTSTVSISKIRSIGQTRQLWVEQGGLIFVSQVDLIGEYKPDHPYRGNDGGVYWQGHYPMLSQFRVLNGAIETDTGTERHLGVIRDGYVKMTRTTDSTQRAIEAADVVESVTVESVGRGIQARKVVGCTVYADGDQGLKAVEAFNCEVGKERWEPTVQTFEAEADQVVFDLDDSAFHAVQSASRANPAWFAGTPHTMDRTEYTVGSDGLLTMKDKARAGDVVTIEYVRKHTDSFTATANQTLFTLTQAGAERLSDILSVKINGVAAAYTAGRNSSGRTTITVSARTADDAVEVVYLPSLKRYGGVEAPATAVLQRCVDLTAVNITKLVAEGGRFELTNPYLRDLDAGLEIKDGCTHVEWSGGSIKRVKSYIVTQQSDYRPSLTIKGVQISNWGLNAALTNAQRNALRRPASSVLLFDRFELSGCTFEKGSEPGAYSGIGGNGNANTKLTVHRNNTYINTGSASMGGATLVEATNTAVTT